MEIELALLEHSFDEKRHSVASNMITKPSDPQSNISAKKIHTKSTLAYRISKSRYSFFFKINNIDLFYIYH
jgi:hypothetical protein